MPYDWARVRLFLRLHGGDEPAACSPSEAVPWRSPPSRTASSRYWVGEFAGHGHLASIHSISLRTLGRRTLERKSSPAPSRTASPGGSSGHPRRTTTSLTISSVTSGAPSSTRRSAAPIPYPRGPSCATRSGSRPRGRAPHLGEHTRQVLEGALGLPAAQVDALAAAGVIR